jgi:hypothetical protein
VLRAGPPRPVRLAGFLVLADGLFGAGFGVYVLVRASAAALSLRAVLGESGMFLVLGALVVVVGLGLLRGRSWSRTPAILVQALLLPMAFSMLGPSGQVLIGALVGIYAIGTLALLLGGPAKRWSMALDEARRNG